MGLDMYLSKKIYIGAEYEHRKVAGKIIITVNGKKVPVNFRKVSEIVERVAYWRKANQIHAWFIKNCQDGRDECQESHVSRDQLKELLADCKKVKKSKKVAKEVSPPTSGFFFGNTNIDEYYMEDIDYTIKVLKEILADKEDESDYYYRASW